MPAPLPPQRTRGGAGPPTTVDPMAMTRGGKVLMCTSIGVALSAVDTTIVNVARDTIGKELHGSDGAVSWVLSGYSIVFAAVLLTSGRLADRYGRKRVYMTGLTIFIVSSAACGFAWHLNVLIAGRAVQAVGAALLTPSALALVLPEYPVERRSSALAVWGMVASTSAAIGPPLGSLMIESWGWRFAFFVNIPMGVTGWVLGRKLLHEHKDPNAQGIPDIVSVLCGVGAVGVIALAFTESNKWGFIGPRALIAYAIAAALIPVFIWRCTAARLPVLDLGLLRSRSFSTANVAGVLFSIPFYGALVADLSFLQRQWGYTVLGAGLAATLTPIFSFLVSRPTGRLCDQFGHRKVVVPGALILALSAFLRAALLTSDASYWTRFALPNALTGAGLGILIPSIQSGAVKYLKVDRMAMGSAFYTTVRQLGAALGVALTVAMLQRSGHSPLSNFRASWMLHGIVAVGVAVVMIVGFRPPADA